MSTLLITDSGELRDADCPRLRRELLHPVGDFRFIDYCVRNLGFIAFRRLEGNCQVRLRPAKVSKVALALLFQLLGDERPERVVLSREESQPADQLIRDWRHAVHSIGATVGAAQDGIGEAFLRATRDLRQLDARDTLGGMFSRWRERAGQVDVSAIPALVGEGLLSRHIVVERPADRGGLTLRSLGAGFLTVDNALYAHGPATNVEHHPDYYYGQWVSELYRAAFERCEPMLDDVDAFIARPREGRQRVRYRRLVVPIRGRDDSMRLLGASVLDSSIDLRGELG